MWSVGRLERRKDPVSQRLQLILTRVWQELLAIPSFKPRPACQPSFRAQSEASAAVTTVDALDGACRQRRASHAPELVKSATILAAGLVHLDDHGPTQ